MYCIKMVKNNTTDPTLYLLQLSGNMFRRFKKRTRLKFGEYLSLWCLQDKDGSKEDFEAREIGMLLIMQISQSGCVFDKQDIRNSRFC